MTDDRWLPRRTLVALGLAVLLALLIPENSRGQQRGPIIVPRSLGDPSIHEGPAGPGRAGYRTVFPQLGLLPASYEWFGGILRAIGSLFQPFAANPRYLGYRSGQQVGYDFRGAIGYRRDVRPSPQPGDTPSLGTVCGTNPGDAFWVGYPRPGNVEIPPPYQIAHHPWDCFCRCNEMIECPIPWHPDWHRNWGGPDWNTRNVSCQQCFGSAIRKHDRYVGRDHDTFPGYPRGDPGDPGYQECLRQSFESFAGSGPGREPGAHDVYGL